MKKIAVILLLLPFFFSSTVNADSLLEKKEYYSNEIKQIEKELEGTDKRKKIIRLNQEMNDLKSYERAYEKAMNQSKETMALKDVPLLDLNEPPSKFVPIYKSAAKKYNLDWTLLAAVHKVETNFSQHPTMISSAGAIGHMQFMPSTWDYYGVDGNGDGKVDPWNVEDAIFSAGNYLSSTGASKGDIKGALFAYNRSTAYGNEVIRVANSYKEGFSNKNIPVVDVGKKFIGNSRYVFGGGRSSQDIKNHIFDCSSFVHWAYKQNGVSLGDLTSVTTDTLKNLGKPVRTSEIKSGDLVFFDTYKKDGHVGIYAGNGKFIGAQESTGVAVGDMTHGYWKDKFNGRIKRIDK